MSVPARAVLIAADLKGANLTKANLEGAKLTRADLEGAKLNGVDFRNANLKDANLWGAEVNCEQLKTTDNWELTYRKPELACGADIPAPPG